MSSIIGLFSSSGPDDTSNTKLLLKHTAIEFLATTIFVYFGTLSAVSTGTKLGGGSGEGSDVARIFPIAFSFGIMIMCLAYSIGHITGGHMNPGVSFMMLLRKQMSLQKMVFYWFAQFFGAMLGSAFVWGSTNGLGDAPYKLGSNTLDPNITVGNGFLVEIIGSFFFYFVISQTALDTKGIGNTSFPPIAIGFSLVVTHICLIPFTGCGVNPARTFGPAVVVCAADKTLCGEVVGSWWWIYWAGPFFAAFLVAEVNALMEWDVEDKEEVKEEVKEDDLVDEEKIE